MVYFSQKYICSTTEGCITAIKQKYGKIPKKCLITRVLAFFEVKSTIL